MTKTGLLRHFPLDSFTVKGLPFVHCCLFRGSQQLANYVITAKLRMDSSILPCEGMRALFTTAGFTSDTYQLGNSKLCAHIPKMLLCIHTSWPPLCPNFAFKSPLMLLLSWQHHLKYGKEREIVIVKNGEKPWWNVYLKMEQTLGLSRLMGFSWAVPKWLAQAH